MASVDMQDRVERFDAFFRDYYEDRIAELAQHYPAERRSLHVDWTDLYRFDEDLAEDVRTHPDQLIAEAEEALRLFDLPVDVSLGQAHVRIRDLPETTDIRDIRSEHVNRLVAVRGIIRKATGVKPRVERTAFECQRCGTVTHVPQEGGRFQEPHQCEGCERKGPFRIDESQSEFVDAQRLRIQESPEGLRGGQTPESIDVHIEDDITGEVSPGDSVRGVGVLRLAQQSSGGEKSTMFDIYMEGVSIEAEEEQFDEMDITDADEAEIVAMSDRDDIYEQMVDSIAPSIYGYENAKLAMVLQLFSGVTKNLPDGSMTRGDMHLLLIGDPGTGKCQKYDTNVLLGDGQERKLGEIVEDHLDDPTEIDDGYYQETDFEVLSVDGSQIRKRRASKVWKREAPDHLYRIQTESGREVEVTPSHPLFVQERIGIEPSTAGELREGEFLAVPRRLPAQGDDTLDISIDQARQTNANSFEIPDSLTPELARYLGYIIGEGHVSNSRNCVVVTNGDTEIVEDLSNILRRLGLRFRVNPHHTSASTHVVECSSTELVRFLNEIEPAMLERSAHQRVPSVIQRSSLSNTREFLKAYIEGECTVSPKEREIAVSSMSEALLQGVRSLLLRFAIDSQIHPKSPHDSYRLRISGADFDRYIREIGFVTNRKAAVASGHANTNANSNREVIPNLQTSLKRIRSKLHLSQFECGIPRSTYQHYERGDRNPTRQSLRQVVAAFDRRVTELHEFAERLESGRWDEVVRLRTELGVSQDAIANRVDVTQTAISYNERKNVVPDGGVIDEATGVLSEELHRALSVTPEIERLRGLVAADVGWDRIESIERIEPEDEWVYDLEVEETHNYISNGVISHNSKLLQYTRNIAPRSVYTSGKGSSAAGLCVTGDTVIHTEKGLRSIRDIATTRHPDPVSENTAAVHEEGMYTFDVDRGTIEHRESSHVWRMPEKPCRRIETCHGKELEASVNTPILTVTGEGLAWKPIGELVGGDHVGVPRYGDVQRTTPPIEEYLAYTNEKVRLTEQSIAFLRKRLRDRCGSLRAAAAALDLTEDFIYDTLRNRYIAPARLDTVLAGANLDRADLTVRRAMLAHGHDVRIPASFDEDLLYLVGLVFGDGDISIDRRDENRGMVRISNNDEALLARAAEIIERTFEKRVEIEYQEDRVPCIRLQSATIAHLFSNLGMVTPKRTLALDPDLTTADDADAFLRGLLDADGSVTERDDGSSSIEFSTISERLAIQVQLMLATYGVHAHRRTRDPSAPATLENGQSIAGKHPRHVITIYGRDIERYGEEIGFDSRRKQAALDRIRSNSQWKDDIVPIGDAFERERVGHAGGQYWTYFNHEKHPGREKAREILDTLELGAVEADLAAAVEADLVWEEVVAVEETGEKEVFDLTVPGTHSFIGNGIVTHNTAAAVRDDFGDGTQWSLEAGALVLADQGVAAIDELDKMAADDRSALHEGLEAQEISISKAGINATLKARCSLLGAANPQYGRFDPYEPMGEQIDLEPALISRFDLIFTVTDQPDAEQDRDMAEHILETNYAGELHTRREKLQTPEVSQAEVDAVSRTVTPSIEPELFRKYVAFAQQSCYPRMTDEAREAIRDFYVDLRERGTDEDAPVPVTARKLEALVRLAEASARVRLSDTVDLADAERVIELVRSCLQDIGVDPETGQYDADVIETGRSKTQRDRVRDLKDIIRELQQEYEGGAPTEEVLSDAEAAGIDRAKAEHDIQKLRDQGEVYSPQGEHLRLT